MQWTTKTDPESLHMPVQIAVFEFPTFLPSTNLGLPMHGQSALTEHVSLNLAGIFLLDPVDWTTTTDPGALNRPVQKKSPPFEFPAFLPPTNLGQPMRSTPALTEHVALNLAGTFLLEPVD